MIPNIMNHFDAWQFTKIQKLADMASPTCHVDVGGGSRGGDALGVVGS